jgi:hypothetical protein
VSWTVRATVRVSDGSVFQTYWPGEPKPGKPKVWTGNPGKALLFDTEPDAKACALGLMLADMGTNVVDVWVELLTKPKTPL